MYLEMACLELPLLLARALMAAAIISLYIGWAAGFLGAAFFLGAADMLSFVVCFSIRLVAKISKLFCRLSQCLRSDPRRPKSLKWPFTNTSTSSRVRQGVPAARASLDRPSECSG